MLDDKDKKKFAQIMYGVAGNFGGKITTDLLKLQFKVLSEYTIHQLTMAGVWLLKNRKEKFPAVPTVKEFIEAIQIITAPQLSLETQAQEQCDIILKYLSAHGSHCTHIFKNTTTRHLMETRWSFSSLGKMPEVEIKWFRKDFIKAWCALEKHAIAKKDQIEYQKQVETLEMPDVKLKKIT